MNDRDKTHSALIRELEEARNTIAALKLASGIANDLLTDEYIDILRENDEKFRVVINQAPQPYQSLDSEGSFLLVNQAWLDTLGYTKAEVIGKRFSDFLAEEELPSYKERFPKFKSSGSVDTQISMKRKDGTLVQMHIAGRILFDADGKFSRTHCVLEDVTNKQNISESFKYSMDHALFPIRINNAEGRFTYANQAMLDIFGYADLEEMNNTPYTERYKPDYQKIVEQNKEKQLRGDFVSERIQHDIIRKDGEIRTVDMLINKIWWENEEQFQVMYQDITDRLKAESELRTEKELLSVVTAHSGAMIAYMDNAFNFIWVNDAYAANSGFQPAEMVGHNHFGLFPDAENESIFVNVRDTGRQGVYFSKPFVYPNQPDRGITYWDWTLTPVKTVDGYTEGLILTLLETTEFVKMEGELALRAQLLDNATDSICLVNREGELVYVNTSFCRIHGFTKEELLGKSMTEIPTTATAELFEDIDTQLQQKGRAVFETTHFHKDGTPVDLEVHASVMEINGQRYTLNAERDITERNRVRADLEGARDLYKQLFDQAPIGVGIVAMDGTPHSFNDVMLNMTGYTRDELQNINITKNYVDPKQRSILLEYLERDGEVSDFVTELKRKDGSPYTAKLGVKLITISGKPFIQTVCVDITDQVKKETELIESESRFKTIFNGTRDGIIIASVDTREMIMVNQTICDMLGYSSHELEGKTIEVLHPVEYHDSLLEDFDMQLTKDPPFSQDVPVKAKDGSLIYFDINSNPVDINGQQYLVGIFRDATERRSAESQIIQEKEKAEYYFDIAGAILLELDTDGAIIKINQEGCGILGQEHEEIQGKNWFDLAIPETRREDIKQLHQRITRGMAAGSEYVPASPIISSSGQIRYIDWYNKVLVANDAIIGTFSTGIDITERYLAEKGILALNGASRAVLQSTDFESAARQIFDYCRDITGASSGYIALLNERTNENDVLFLEAGGKSCTVDPSLPMPVRGLRAEAYKSCEVVYDNDFMGSEWQKYLPAGHVTLDNVLFAPLIINDKAVGVIGLANKEGGFSEDDKRIVKSFSEICSVALMNSRYLDNLSVSEEKYRLLFESITDGFALHEIVLDDEDNPVDYVFLEANAAFEEMTGLRRDEIIGRRVTEVIPGIENDKGDWIGRYGRVVLTGESERFEQYGESLDRTFSVLAFKSKNNQFCTIFQDITLQRRLEQEAQKAANLEAVGTLAGGLAHDFNNILTGIVGNISLTGLEVEDGKKQEALERLKEAENAAFRARDLTQQLLTFSRGGLPVKRLINISDMLRETSEFALRGSHIKPVFNIAEDLFAIYADEGQINQVVTNIVINARQAMDDQGLITVSANNKVLVDRNSYNLQPGRYLELVFSDSGSGMDEETVSKIFQPYFTTKKLGTGLGLASSYSIVKNHRGNIAVQSEIGKGTVFTILLPASEKQIDAVASEHQGNVQKGNGRILVMDDEEPIRKLLAKGLASAGFDVATVADGEAAIKSYEEALSTDNKFSAVIMDLTIPGAMGGKEAVHGILEIDPNALVIVSSGYSTDPIMANYREYGFSGVIEKPYNIEKMRRVLADLLETNS